MRASNTEGHQIWTQKDRIPHIKTTKTRPPMYVGSHMSEHPALGFIYARAVLGALCGEVERFLRPVPRHGRMLTQDYQAVWSM